MKHNQEEMPEKEGPWRGALSPLRVGRPLARIRGLAVLLALAGLLITIGLLKPSLEEVECVGMDVSKNGSDLLVLSIKEMEQDWGESIEVLEEFEEAVEKDSEKEDSPKDDAIAPKRTLMAREKDLAGIALERYGTLDVDILRTLQEENPQVQDWNRLDDTEQLVLPEVPQATNRGADFYTIQVGAFASEEGASRRASDLAKRGAQNLFLIREKKLTSVCVGVFESRQQASEWIGIVQEWGLDDAFPVRMQEKRLEDILQPYSGSISYKAKQQDRPQAPYR